MQTVKTTNKPLSIDGLSVSSAKNGVALFRPDKPKATRRAWIDAHEMWIAVLPRGEKRAITPIVIKSSLYWMDAVTGGIHWPVGMEAYRNVDEATEILMSIDSVGESSQYRQGGDDE